MDSVTTWTGWEANALRKALRMSLTDFAAHLGVGRRTVVNWSSRGRGIELRPEMQAALDTVLGQAGPETRERFERHRTVRAAEPRAAAASGEGASGTAVSRLLDVLLSRAERLDDVAGPSSLEELHAGVRLAKGDYQACRYASLFGRLSTLLPSMVKSTAETDGDVRARLQVLGVDLYHVTGSVLLKHGCHSMALVAAERSTRSAVESGDPVAVGAAARIMTHALLAAGHGQRARQLAEGSAIVLARETGLRSVDSLAVYGALLLRGAAAAGRTGDRDAASTLLNEATIAGSRLGRDGNDRWTGFGPNNVRQHRVSVALMLGDAGTAVTLARQVQIDKIMLAERKVSLFVDVAQAYVRWGRHEQGLSALWSAYGIAPEEIRSRPAVHRVVSELAMLSGDHRRAQVRSFAATAGIPL